MNLQISAIDIGVANRQYDLIKMKSKSVHFRFAVSFFDCFSSLAKIIMRSSYYAFLVIIVYCFFVIIDARGKNYIGQNDALQLKEVAISDDVEIPFYVGSLHHDWCLLAEYQQVHLFTTTLRKNHSDCFVIDVGMNDGFYTNMAGVLGCRVYSFELQIRCIDLARLAIEKNGIKDRVTIFNHPVSGKISPLPSR